MRTCLLLSVFVLLIPDVANSQCCCCQKRFKRFQFQQPGHWIEPSIYRYADGIAQARILKAGKMTPDGHFGGSDGGNAGPISAPIIQYHVVQFGAINRAAFSTDAHVENINGEPSFSRNKSRRIGARVGNARKGGIF